MPTPTGPVSRVLLKVTVVVMVLASAGSAVAQLRLTTHVSGLSSPVGMVQDPGDPSVQYVVEQQGRVRVIQNGSLLGTHFISFLGAGNPVHQGNDERGLLGMALPPATHPMNGYAFLYFINTANNSVLARFKRSSGNPLTLDPASRFDLEWPSGQRFIEQPSPASSFPNHKGGKIAFGPDGYLYVGMGDGGSGGDPGNRAQDPATLLGKILRIDVNVSEADAKGYRIPADNPFVDGNPINALGEIWDFGVRNPWRFTFDDPAMGGTGAMVMADVGQGAREEVNYEPAGKGGRNYGWSIREGLIAFSNKTAAFTPLTDPIWDYPRTFGQSITGGYVYRGSALGPAFRGRYFVTDYVSSRLVSLGLTIDGATGEASAVSAAQVMDHTTELGGSGAYGNLSSIDVDAQGELYLVSRSRNAIYKLGLVDADSDGLPDGWEMQFGLNTASAAGNDGPDGDPDGDSRTNGQELAAGTHPKNVLALNRYLAEGSSSTFFETTIGVANPGTTAASVLLRFLRTDGVVITHAITVPGERHATVRPGDLIGLQTADFSTIVETDQEVVIERTMTWTRDARYGSHSERGITAPATTWFLAEGATHGAFDTYYLLENPSNTQASVDVTYLLPAASPIVRTVTVDPQTRRTIWVDQEPGLAETDVSASLTVTNGVGIIVERAMYRSTPGTSFSAGHDSAGVTAPATNWFFAEGATGSFFDLFLLLANPNTTTTPVTVRYLLAGGASPIVKQYTLNPQSRTTINVENEDQALVDAPVSIVVEATNPIVAERSMYWPGPSGSGWLEAHNSPGTTETGVAWALAGGEEGNAFAAQTYVLIANTSSFAGTARVTVLREGAAPLTKEINLGANSRTNVPIGVEFPTANNSRFGVLVESLGSTPAQIVVERATYTNDVAGTVWAAGSNTLANKLR